MSKGFQLNTTASEPKITSQILRAANEDVYMNFSISFLSTSKKYNLSSKVLKNNHYKFLVKRIHELSTTPWLEVLTLPKNRGVEKLKLNSLSSNDRLKRVQINMEFNNSIRSNKAGEDFWVFRLCPNNSPYPTRIIGKMIDHHFYILFIDYEHELYSKRK